MIAAGNVAASNRSVEQHVAHMGKAHLLAEKHHAAGRMTRAMQNLKRQLPDRDPIPFFEPAVRCEIAHTGHAEAGAAGHDVVEQEFVGVRRPLDRNFSASLRSAAPPTWSIWPCVSQIFSTDT